MSYSTFEEMDGRIRRKLALIDEPIVSGQEMMDYVNDGIKKAEAQIHTLYEDYFFTFDHVPLVQGQSEYDMPADLYANKLRGVVYRAGSQGALRYPVKRLHGKNLLASIMDLEQDPGAAYSYYVRNSYAGATQFVLLPPSRETADNVMRRFYIRRANQITAVTDVCDIPEFHTFIEAHATHLAALKAGHPEIATLLAERDAQEQLMVTTLQAMVPDEDNLIEPDMGHYEEHV